MDISDFVQEPEQIIALDMIICRTLGTFNLMYKSFPNSMKKIDGLVDTYLDIVIKCPLLKHVYKMIYDDMTAMTAEEFKDG